MIRQAMTHQQAGRFSDAAKLYTFVLSKQPDHPDALHLRGVLRTQQGMAEGAVEDIEAALRVRPETPPFLYNLGHAYRLAGRTDEAVHAYEHVLRLMPKHPPTLIALARVQEIRGEDDAARGALDALPAGAEGPTAVAIRGRLDARAGDPVAVAATLRSAAAKVSNDSEAVDLLFTAAQVCDRAGAHEEAATLLGRANRAKGARFDCDRFRRGMDRLIEAFDSDHVRESAGAREGGGEGLVYVLGMPRSGTSLVEQILTSHPSVTGGGELTVVPQLESLLEARCPSRAGWPGCLGSVESALLDEVCREGAHLYERAMGTKFGADALLTDKLPSNFRRVGLIRLLFPRARIVHCIRDAEDTCLSCYMQEFAGGTHPYAYDLESLACYYHQYERIMAFWSNWGFVELHEVRYEELVSEQARVTRALVEGVGLAWDEACLRPQESERRVATASYAQVREAVHRRSVRRADRYAGMMEDFRAALERERGMSADG